MWLCFTVLYYVLCLLCYTTGIQSFHKTEAEFCPKCEERNMIAYNTSCHTFTCQVPIESRFAQLIIDGIVLPPQPEYEDALRNKTYLLCSRIQLTGVIILHIPDFCGNNHTIVSCGCTYFNSSGVMVECYSNLTEPLHIEG